MFFTLRLRLLLGLICLMAGIGAGGVVAVQSAAPLTLRPLFEDEPFLPLSPVRFAANRPVTEGFIRLEPPVPGDVKIDGHVIIFRPAEPLRPGARYDVHVVVRDAAGRESAMNVPFQVGGADLLWVYVELDKGTHWVHVFQGDERVRRMLASGGRPGDETPEGTFRIQNRGYHFWSQKYGEGAYYWVRIFGNYLFHSVPVDHEGRIIEEEARRLGCPASHGCIRLRMDDARWFYENVPDGTWVLIDRRR